MRAVDVLFGCLLLGWAVFTGALATGLWYPVGIDEQVFYGIMCVVFLCAAGRMVR